MEKSLFGGLYSYRPSPNRLPEEDFFTEALAGVLHRERDLAQDVFELLTELRVEPGVIQTQVRYPRSDAKNEWNRIDLMMTGYDNDGMSHIAFVECKIGAKEGYEQLPRYLKSLRNLSGYRSKTLCYITRDADPKTLETGASDIKFRKFRWSEIFSHLQSPQRTYRKIPLIDELLAFMEELGMSHEVHMSELIAGVSLARAQSRIMSLLDAAWAGFSKGGRFSGGRKSSYSWQAIGIFSPKEPNTGIQIDYGMWFDTSSPGKMHLEFDDPEVPIAYVAIGEWSGKASELYRSNKDYFEALKKHQSGWLLIPDGPQTIARRTLAVGAPGAKAVTVQLERFYQESFQQIEHAPFLSG